MPCTLMLSASRSNSAWSNSVRGWVGSGRCSRVIVWRAGQSGDTGPGSGIGSRDSGIGSVRRHRVYPLGYRFRHDRPMRPLQIVSLAHCRYSHNPHPDAGVSTSSIDTRSIDTRASIYPSINLGNQSADSGCSNGLGCTNCDWGQLDDRLFERRREWYRLFEYQIAVLLTQHVVHRAVQRPPAVEHRDQYPKHL